MTLDEPRRRRRVVNGQGSSQESKGKQQVQQLISTVNLCEVDQQGANYTKANSVNREGSILVQKCSKY